MEYVQQVSVSIEPAKLGEAQPLFEELEAHRTAIRRAPGFIHYQLARSVEPDGETLLTVESRWRDAAGLAEYASGPDNAEAIMGRYPAAVNLDGLRVRRMEALDTTAAPKTGVIYERFAIAAMVPLIIVALGFSLIYGLSRIYLQLGGNSAVALAGLVALGILAAAWVVATQPQMPSWALASGGATVVVALIAGAVAAEVREGPEYGGEHGAVESPTPPVEFFVELKDNEFGRRDITIPPGQDVVLELRNTGAAIHNMHVQVGDGYDEDTCTTGGEEPCSDPNQIRARRAGVITINLPAGTYNFRCDFHVNEDMTGTLTVEEGAPVPGEPTPGGPGAPGGPAGEPGGPAGPTIEMQDNEFAQDEVRIQADSETRITLVNTGTAIHNMHVAVDGDYAEDICDTDGPAPCSDPNQIRAGRTGTITLNLPAGEYAFRCDFHINEDMVGTLLVE